MNNVVKVTIFVVILVIACMGLSMIPPQDETEETQYGETTLAAVMYGTRTNETEITSYKITSDREILRSADVVVILHTSPEYEDYDELGSFIVELVMSGKLVLSEIGSSVFEVLKTVPNLSTGLSDSPCEGVYYNPETKVPHYWSIDDSNSDHIQQFIDWYCVNNHFA